MITTTKGLMTMTTNAMTTEQIKCPNGVIHTRTGEDDFVSFIVEPEFVEDYKKLFDVEPYNEEWEVQQLMEEDSSFDEDYIRGLGEFSVPNLKSIVDPNKSMSVSEIMKCFKIQCGGLKGWVRFIESCEEESEIFDY